MAEPYRGHDTIWAKWNETAQAHKEKRKAIGRWSANEPEELIFDKNIIPDEWEDEDGCIHSIYPNWHDTNLYSQYWVSDLFGSDFKVVSMLLCDKELDIVIVEDNVYYRERFVEKSLEILELLAKTEIVNNLRPIPLMQKEQNNPVYSSKDLMRILDVKEATLKKYRDNGLLGYSKVGDKFWYTQKDLDSFLTNPNHRYEAFNQ
ncbi:MAG: helix-turn-helix domain-containing protein [Muribaculaceae bacterium]|nr:helix-turn-helix domain-containing protein [Muribaculaceae bacterium]